MMNPFPFFKHCLVALLALASASTVVAAPKKIQVPAHLTYCVSSQPLNVTAYELPEVRESLFQTLYERLEQAVLKAGLASMGVAFVDAVTPGPDIPGSAQVSPNTLPKMLASFIVRQCAVVGSRGTPELPKDGVVEVPARTMYASLCTPEQVESCKRDIEALVRKDNPSPADVVRPIVWRTRPALMDSDSSANLVASMVDDKLLMLKDGQASLTSPKNLFVHAAELAH